MTLKDLQIGQSARIVSVGGTGALRQHFLDMGVIPGVQVTLVKLAPMGDPLELRLHGYELTLRMDDAAQITVRMEKEDKTVLPEEERLTFALVGNQNCGKTTLFNRLTGANQHVGNFPGVTVERKDGVIRGHGNLLVTDLPGIYSMSPYSGEELVTRRFILEEKPNAIINIVDAANLERNLYLTTQLMELEIPLVLALNMMDEVRDNGGIIRVKEMEQMLGIPVIPIAAVHGEGICELVDRTILAAKHLQRPVRKDFCTYERSIMHLVKNRAERADIPLRFAASKLAEGDRDVLETLKLDDSEQKNLAHIIHQMEEEYGLDRAAVMANLRFRFVETVCRETVVNPGESKGHIRSQKLDRFLTGTYTALPAFAGIMALVFWLTFGVIGTWMADMLDMGIAALTDLADTFLSACKVNPVLHSLVIDGIFNGVGSVLRFLPVIVTLFFFLSILEDSGYMARVAFMMDKLLRKIGLSGRSIVPMLIGFGCTVPGVMAARTLPSERDRKMTILLTPFMSCTAKVPIYALFTAAFFPEHGTLVMIALYFGGIVTGILMALLLRGIVFRDDPVPFVMELPNYRFPGVRNVAQLLWEKAGDFIARAFTVIFTASIVIWFLQTFDPQFHVAAASKDSILASAAGVIAPVFRPLGFGNWQITTALITGFLAKESVVSTLTLLLGDMELAAFMTPLTAVSLLVFTLLYTPCVAAVSAIKRELGGKWAAAVVIGQCAIAWVFALFVRAIGLLLGFV